MFQRCPICEGKGTTYYPVSNHTSSVCKTCNGTGIISQITGLPPVKTNTNHQLGFIDDDEDSYL